MANVSLAYNYGKKGNDGNRPSNWVDATLWGPRAESLAPHLLKGTQIEAVLSDVHIEEYETRDGRKGSKMVARIDDLEFASAKREDGGQQQPPGKRPAGNDYQRTREGSAPQRPAQQSAPSSGSFADMEDDMPPF